MININTQFQVNEGIDLHISSSKDGLWHYVSMYNDLANQSISYQCSTKEVKALADFLYKTIGEKK